jgi:hypothetical protein
MLQVLIGLFTSNRDGEDALQALQMLGLSPGNGHLYQKNRHDSGPPLPSGSPPPDLDSEERAEYAAHGEYLDVSGAANRYSAETDCATPSIGGGSVAGGSATERTLLVVEDICGLRPATACTVLFDHGAVAVKDPSGHWRFSPHRNVCLKQG